MRKQLHYCSGFRCSHMLQLALVTTSSSPLLTLPLIFVRKKSCMEVCEWEQTQSTHQVRMWLNLSGRPYIVSHNWPACRTYLAFCFHFCLTHLALSDISNGFVSFLPDTSSCGHIWLCHTYLAGTGPLSMDHSTPWYSHNCQ